MEVNKNFVKRNYEFALKETFLRMDTLLSNNEGKTEVVKIQKEMRERENAPKTEEESHAGCTAVVCLITSEFIYVANAGTCDIPRYLSHHAGDSRAVVCSLKGEAKELSRDHKPEEKSERERILKAKGTIEDGRINGNLNLSRAIGDFEYKCDKTLSAEEQIITANPEITKIKNEGLDFLIIGCDGIWESKTSGEMVGWLKGRVGKKPLGAILEELFDESLAKDCEKEEKGLDNMSAILIKFLNKGKK